MVLLNIVSLVIALLIFLLIIVILYYYINNIEKIKGILRYLIYDITYKVLESASKVLEKYILCRETRGKLAVN